MYKRALCLLLCLAMSLSFACAKDADEDSALAGQAQDTPVPEGNGPFNTAEHCIGFLVRDDGQFETYAQMYGFLRTAENLCYAARLYRYTTLAQAAEAVEQAKTDGCEGVVFYDADGVTADLVSAAKQNGMVTAVSYQNAPELGADCNVAADQEEYLAEMARGVAERMTERNLKAGRLMVYGYETDTAYAAFCNAIAQDYPQYSVTYFTRVQREEQAAIEELANFIYENRDVKGMFCTDTDSTAIAVKARSQAQKLLKAAEPTPTPRQTPAVLAPNATPVPSALLKEILITVFGSGINGQTIELLEDNDIYGVVSQPHYESAAQCTMLLDALLRGKSAASITKLNIPIVRQDTMEKYVAVYEQVLDWFELETN